jgi:hypothetical protein
MNPLNTPPPMPAITARTSSTVYDVFGVLHCHAPPDERDDQQQAAHPDQLRVPMIGGRNIHTSRRKPPANPGMAASQYSCPLLN